MNDKNYTIWPAAQGAAEGEKTRANAEMEGYARTTGWLVSVSGPEKGRDYRLGAGQNSIGRGYEREVVIYEDREITREAHAYVIYDDRTVSFYLKPGIGTAVYMAEDGGEQFVRDTVPLRDGAKIRIGETELVFVAFCRPDRNWNEPKEVEEEQ